MNKVKTYYLKDLEKITENWHRRDLIPFLKILIDHEWVFLYVNYTKLVYLDCCAVNELFVSEDFYGDVLKYKKKLKL